MDWDFMGVAKIALLTFAIFIVIFGVRKTSARFKAKWLDPVRLVLWKLLWVIPVALGVGGGVLLPGFFEDDTLGVKIVKGAIAGFCALWFRKGFKRLFKEKFGVDIDVDKPGLVK